MTDPTNRPLTEWIADLDASDAEYESGLLIPGETVMAEIQAAIDRFDSRPVQRPAREVLPRR